MKPIRVQRKRTKGWKMPKNTVYVGRPTKWGNPFILGKDGTINECLLKYRKLIEGNLWSNPNKNDARTELRGKNLACFCPLNKPCHADILLEIANK